MSPLSATAVFTTAMWAVLFGTSLIDVFVFNHFEGAIGDRGDNLRFSALVEVALSLAAALGFSGTLALLHSRILPGRQPRIWLAISGALACALVYAFALVGPLLSRISDSWQLNVAPLLGYCVVVGALVGTVVSRAFKGKGYAA